MRQKLREMTKDAKEKQDKNVKAGYKKIYMKKR